MNVINTTRCPIKLIAVLQVFQAFSGRFGQSHCSTCSGYAQRESDPTAPGDEIFRSQRAIARSFGGVGVYPNKGWTPAVLPGEAA